MKLHILGTVATKPFDLPAFKEKFKDINEMSSNFKKLKEDNEIKSLPPKKIENIENKRASPKPKPKPKVMCYLENTEDILQDNIEPISHPIETDEMTSNFKILKQEKETKDLPPKKENNIEIKRASPKPLSYLENTEDILQDNVEPISHPIEKQLGVSSASSSSKSIVNRKSEIIYIPPSKSPKKRKPFKHDDLDELFEFKKK